MGLGIFLGILTILVVEPVARSITGHHYAGQVLGLVAGLAVFGYFAYKQYKQKKETEVLKERDLLYSLVENKEAAGARDIMFVKSNSRLVKLKTSDIYFIEALKDYVVINTLNTRYTVHSTMKDIEAKLPEADFIRVHRSFIVRLDKIVAIEQPNLILENDKKVIPIGGSYKDDLAKRLNLV